MRRGVRLALLGALSAAVFMVGGLGLFKGAQHPTRASAARRPGTPGLPGPLVPSASLADSISTLQARLRALPSDWRSLATLGIDYVQQARVTADPSFYPKAQAVLERSLSLQPRANVPAMVGMASLEAARHYFARALDWGRRAEAAAPYSGAVHDVVGDALVELGRYTEAFRELQRAVDVKPNLSSYARASYAHELQGDVAGAVGIMELALQAAGTPQDRAWTLNQLGDLAFNAGRPGHAYRHYRMAVRSDAKFVPPRAGLAKVNAARGRLGRAIAGFRWVVARYPLPEYVAALGDLYARAGRGRAARQQYGLVHVEERLFMANGVNVGLEIALFDADHRVDLAQGLAAARAEWSRRHSIHVADALAWELYANGRPSEALPYANRALRLGTRSAQFYFHRGMIERALGMKESAMRDLARALDINPHFSILWAPRAARILASMGGAP